MSETLPDYQRPTRCNTCDTARALTMRADSADWSAEALAVENRILRGAVDALTARALKAEARVKEQQAELGEQEVAKLVLVLDIRAVSKRLHEALDSLGDMYGQYCPGEYGHDFMSAGEGAQDVLGQEGLLDDAFNFKGMPLPPEAMITLAARVKEQQAELGEQEVNKLRMVLEGQRLKDAIRKASAPRMNAAEREAYASNTTGQGTRGAFGAGEIMGRVSLAQDLLNLFDL